MRTRLATALEFLLYAALAALMLHATWLTWPDDLIDFSRELYLPWRVSCGDILYRDLAYDFGPLSVYTNAALFALLGRPSIHALFSLNFAFWVATLLALRTLLRRIARPSVVIVCLSLFIVLFSFNRFIHHPLGNLNYLAPYSHELPRGFLLALLSLLSLDSALRRRSVLLSLSSGFLLGLSIFTKPEIALAAIAATVVFFLARFLGDAPPGDAASSRVLLKPGRPARDGGASVPSHVWTFALGLLLALATVLLPLSAALGSFSQALRHGLLDLYLACFNPALTAHPFYRTTTGLDAPLPNTLRLLLGAGLATAPFLLVRLLLSRVASRPLRLSVSSSLVLAAAAIGFFAFLPLNAALPVAPILFALLVLNPANHCPRTAIHLHRPLALSFAVFALALVSKIALNCGIGHYGFVLALPAFCCAVLVAFRSPCSATRAAVAATILLGFTAAAIREARLVLPTLSAPIHDGAYLARPVEARLSNAALDWIRANTAPGSTLAVLPEGAILNVLSGRPNSTPYVYLDHPALLRFGEDAVLAAYSNAPPDTLVLVDIRASSKFGIDYAQSIMAFLDPLYTPVRTFTLPSPFGPFPALVIATRTPSLPPP